MRGGCCGDGGGWWFGWGPRPLAARLPSPWDPLLISPWEGEGRWLAGEGTRCCGRGVAVKGVLVVWVEMACFAFLLGSRVRRE